MNEDLANTLHRAIVESYGSESLTLPRDFAEDPLEQIDAMKAELEGAPEHEDELYSKIWHLEAKVEELENVTDDLNYELYLKEERIRELERQAEEVAGFYAPWISMQVWQAQDGWVCLVGERPEEAV